MYVYYVFNTNSILSKYHKNVIFSYPGWSTSLAARIEANVGWNEDGKNFKTAAFSNALRKDIG